MSSDAVVRLACPSCGGMLPLPTAGAEYLLCPFCASSLQLHQTPTGFSLALADVISARVGDQVDQRLLRQQVSMYRIQAEQAQALGHTRAAVLNWGAALELDPSFAPASAWLDGFIGRYVGALTTPMVRELRDLGPTEQEALRILNGNPQLAHTPRLVPPATPPPLGRVSMALLRRIAPRRAEAVAAIHTDRMTAYTTQRTQYDDTCARQNADREQQQQRWQQQDAALRRKRPVMARLCLAVTEAETRLRVEAEQRAAAQQAAAQQQQLAAMQQQLREINNRQRKR